MGINKDDTGISSALGKILEWITGEFHKIISSHKEKLPSKSWKFKYPALLWCLIPEHDIYGHYNDFKVKFNTATIKATRNYKEMLTLPLKAWDSKNSNYFEGGELSPFGLSTYWHAVNQAFEDWDCQNMKASFIQCQTPHQSHHFHHERNFDKYHWKASHCFLQITETQ